jgi:HlyD family type I secretion membrane fusion protein
MVKLLHWKPESSTPPVASSNWKPVVRLGNIIIGGALGTFLLWSLVARLDGAALASGVVSVESNRKTIQHLEGGIVREILVRDGESVKAGQVLLRLDPTKAESADDLYRNQLVIQLAQEVRLRAERDGADKLVFPEEVTSLSFDPVVARAISDQKQQFDGRRDTLVRTIEVADAQIAQAEKEAEQNVIDNRTARATLVTVNRELEVISGLFEKKLVAMTRITALEREKLRLEGVIENTDVGATRLKEKVQELKLRRDQVQQDYHQEAAKQLGELQKSITELRQQLIIATDARRRIDIRAPTNGVVQQMRIFTVGGVVRPGDPILDLVPVSDTLIIKARVSPFDADRVTENMEAEIRFPSFRHMALKIIQGRVKAISRDRLVDDVTKEPYFDAQVGVDRKDLPPEIIDRLTAGMPAEVVIPTGERTVFDYLVTPVVERFQTSMRER